MSAQFCAQFCARPPCLPLAAANLLCVCELFFFFKIPRMSEIIQDLFFFVSDSFPSLRCPAGLSLL